MGETHIPKRCDKHKIVLRKSKTGSRFCKICVKSNFIKPKNTVFKK